MRVYILYACVYEKPNRSRPLRQQCECAPLEPEVAKVSAVGVDVEAMAAMETPETVAMSPAVAIEQSRP